MERARTGTRNRSARAVIVAEVAEYGQDRRDGGFLSDHGPIHAIDTRFERTGGSWTSDTFTCRCQCPIGMRSAASVTVSFHWPGESSLQADNLSSDRTMGPLCVADGKKRDGARLQA